MDVVALRREVEDLAEDLKRLGDLAALEHQVGRVGVAIDGTGDVPRAMQGVRQHQPDLDIVGVVLDDALILTDRPGQVSPRDALLRGL